MIAHFFIQLFFKNAFIKHLFSLLYFCLETKVPKIQGCGFEHTLLQAFADYAKNQTISLKISKLANAQTMEIFYAPFIDFLNATSPMPVKLRQKTQNQHPTTK
ncbi:hypothetical protein [Capnocytophaga stomatis]|uniref:Uncharacterized protein n=1 Tax=Capnocytophaga stomatis TaxID=1848904 RepID=A0ABW8QC64_9FLAO|nr:hypothetical protein [Capnocytophaga stomatis]